MVPYDRLWSKIVPLPACFLYKVTLLASLTFYHVLYYVFLVSLQVYPILKDCIMGYHGNRVIEHKYIFLGHFPKHSGGLIRQFCRH